MYFAMFGSVKYILTYKYEKHRPAVTKSLQLVAHMKIVCICRGNFIKAGHLVATGKFSALLLAHSERLSEIHRHTPIGKSIWLWQTGLWELFEFHNE